jgi:hypothetical protein
MKRNSKLKLLSKVSVELYQVLALNRESLAVLLTIKVLFNQREVFLIDFIIRLREGCSSQLKITVPCIKFFFGNLFACAHILIFREFLAERNNFL